jgi:hypothetical protein
MTPIPQLAERDSMARLLVDRIGEIHDAVLRIRDLKSQVQGFVTRTKEADTARRPSRISAARSRRRSSRSTRA